MDNYRYSFSNTDAVNNDTRGSLCNAALWNGCVHANALRAQKIISKGGRTPNSNSLSAVRHSLQSSRALLEKPSALNIGKIEVVQIEMLIFDACFARFLAVLHSRILKKNLACGAKWYYA